jgi:selenide,water dikinase
MKRLLLIGGGHAHVQVLAALAKAPFAGTEVTLISPYPRQIYSGMLPGWIAGDYSIDECSIPIDRLAQRAGVRFVQTVCNGLDLAAKIAHCENGEQIAFDLLSIDCGPTLALADLPGARQYALPIRPIEGFVAAWPGILEQALEHARQASDFNLAIVGDGAAGTELAFAIQARFAAERLAQAQVTLICANSAPLAGFPERLRNAVSRLLTERGVTTLTNRRALAFLPGKLRLSDETLLDADVSLIVTGAAAPRWPAASGLACDAAGFIRLTRTLQSVSNPFVFAAGDVAAYADPRPKSGVFAVRAGPVLAANLRAACNGQPLQRWRPQTQALYLISTGQHHALAARGALSIGGSWVWYWKDWIDRHFMKRFS